MAYEKTQWVNYKTKLNAKNLNKIEEGVEAASIQSQDNASKIAELEESISDFESELGRVKSDLSTETAARNAAVKSLSEDFDKAIDEISGALSSIDENVVAEKARAESREGELYSQLLAAETQINELSSNISSEKERASQAEDDLAGKIIELTANKQDKLTAGDYITISEDNTISTTIIPYDDTEVRQLIDENKASVVSHDAAIESLIENKQDSLVAGEHIRIDDEDGTISADYYDDSNVRQLISDIETNLNNLSTSYDEFKRFTAEDFDTVNDKIEKTGSVVSGIKKDVATNSGNITSLQYQVELNTTSVAEVKAGLSNAKTQLKEDIQTLNNHVDAVSNRVEGGLASLQKSKQDALSAGNNITITNNVISATDSIGLNFTTNVTIGGIAEGTSITHDMSIAELLYKMLCVQEIPVESLTLNRETDSLQIGSYNTLSATVVPNDATDKTITWFTNPQEQHIVEILDNGSTCKVTGLNPGEIDVCATAGGKVASCHITVESQQVPVTGVSINQSAILLNIGNNYQLVANVVPEYADDKTVSWTSTNPAVASVDDTGYVTAHAKGNTSITVTTNDGAYKADCMCDVKIPVESVEFDESELEMSVDEAYTINYTVVPSDADNKTLAWSSSNKSVATVDNNGVVTSIKPGTTIITATSTDNPSAFANCAITVTGHEPEPTEELRAFYYTGTTVPTSISDSWESESIDESASVTGLTHVHGRGVGYIGVAFNKSLGELTGVFQNGLTMFNLLDDFTRVETTYNNTEYYMYITTEEAMPNNDEYEYKFN